jgi:hypothetical protein
VCARACMRMSERYLIMFETDLLIIAKAKAVPLHTMNVLGVRGGIAPTHSRPRH